MTEFQSVAGVEAPQLPKSVIKRDGSLKPFDHGKILSAILRAGQATGEFAAPAARE
ncbi:MAG: hypothetical protein HY323_10960, partial [Betaproteobacteria bacterium]|nr:hypothetical protein [Betaproteobacteria bacterium]MBI3937489.1 hypothetical protein [Betaproteobacteria bacterium]